MTAPALIGIDWGTSSFRAVLMDDRGKELDRRESPAGILAVPGGDFDAFFEDAVGDWADAHPGLPILASGMITSRNGWVETPYLPLPLTARTLSRAVTRHDTRNGRIVHFVTGACWTTADGLPDVMRGEETELVGQMAETDHADGLYVMPGTHSKWATVTDGALCAFQTVMTGELFAVLRTHSILGKLMRDAAFDEAAFRHGLHIAARDHGSLIGRLFSARTLPLFNEIPETGTADYLSGLLIGDEFRGALSQTTPERITIIGRGALCDRYRIAAAHFGVTATQAAPDRAQVGHFHIAKEAGLLS